MRYRKKPIEVEAIQLKWDTWSEMCDFLGDIVSMENPARLSITCSEDWDDGGNGPYLELTIPTLEGDMIARHGDFIIKGVKGEFYPCKLGIFERTYEAIHDEMLFI